MTIIRTIRRALRVERLVLPAILVCGLAAPIPAQTPQAALAPSPGQQTFGSPEEALASLKTAVAAGDKAALQKLFGPALDEITSGDEVADKAAYARFTKRLEKMSNLVKKSDTSAVLYMGAENWPFPFPITRVGDRWFFDGPAGLDEMFNRRIGENELTTIRVCREYVRAQREYAEGDHDGDEVLEYAQRTMSKPGSRDGLYWETGDDGVESPFGPFVAYATGEGHTVKQEPQPFHGYYFRVITKQGATAPGGAYNYVINGNMIGGFALIAYPATWGSSGLMTFIVSHQGKVYQKDLGRNTAAAAAAMRIYNPDSTWTPVEDH